MVFTMLTLLTGVSVNAQLEQDYQPAVAKGQLPEDFVKLSTTKVGEAIEEIDQSDLDRKEKKTRAEFQLTSNFFVDQILLSGQVLFGDEMTSYVSDIADRVLAHDSLLRDELRFYVVRSSEVNAFSTDPGVIVVTTGLLARADNEAQIAFVLAHEIEHYIEEHTVNAFIEAKKIEEGDKNFDVDKAVRKLSNYSKDQEFEADADGLKLLAKSDYDLKEAQNQLDKLMYGYLPFSNEPFEMSSLETQYFDIPEPLDLDSVQPLSNPEVLANVSDTKSSHPNVASRKLELTDVIEELGSPTDKKFIDAQERFELVKDLARFECIRIDMNRRHYADAIYQSTILAKKYPQNKFLKKAIAKSLYGASVYKTFNYEDKILWSSYDIEGSSQKVHFLLEEMSGVALSMLAVSHVREYLAENPNDQFMTSLEEDLMENIVVNHKITRDSLLNWEDRPLPSPEPQVSREDTVEVKAESDIVEEAAAAEQEEIVEEELPAYASKKRAKDSQKPRPAYADDREEEVDEAQQKLMTNYYLYALTDQLEEESFAKRMKELERKRKIEEQGEGFEYGMTYQEQYKAAKKKRKQFMKEERAGEALGINEVILLDPYTMQFDNDGDAELLKSEENQVKLNALMVENARMNDVKIKSINAKNFESSDIQKFNQGTALHLWINERVLHGDLDMIPLESDFMYDITNELGIDYLNYSIVLVKDDRKQKRRQVIVTALLVTTLPYSLFYAVQPGYNSLYANMVYDLKTGEKLLGDFTSNRGGFRKDYINRWAYDQFWQISRDPSELD